MKLYQCIAMLAVVLGVTACSYTNHFLDEGEEGEDAPYRSLSNLDVSTYGNWTYINLQTGKTEKHPETGEQINPDTDEVIPAGEAPEITIDWHIAISRRGIMKTNGASVLNTGETDITVVNALPATGTYTVDEDASYEAEQERAALGQSAFFFYTNYVMMGTGSLLAHAPTINRVLCECITQTPNPGGMPPSIYGTTGEVFVLKWDDGSWAKFQIHEVGSNTASSFSSIRYKYYPVEQK